MRRFFDKVIAYVRDVATIRNHPHEIALGFAVGVFIAAMPTPGFDIILGLISLFLIRMNKIAVFAGLALFNPFTVPFVYASSLRIGHLFVPYMPIAGIDWYSTANLLANLKPFLIGTFIVSTVLSLIAYTLVFWVAYLYQMQTHKILHPRMAPRAPIHRRLHEEVVKPIHDRSKKLPVRIGRHIRKGVEAGSTLATRPFRRKEQQASPKGL